MAKTAAEKLLKQVKDDDIKYVDLRFTDPKGKLQHVTFHQSMIDEDLFEDGTMFDGSSIAGWKSIDKSDMVLMPDAETAQLDPFYQEDTLAVFCDIIAIWVIARVKKAATSLYKPVQDDNGSGMHVHQSIWKDGKPTFAGHTLHVTVLPLSVFRGQRLQTVSVLSVASLIRQRTHTWPLLPCLWPALTALRTKSIRAMPWTKICTTCHRQKRLKFRRFAAALKKLWTAWMATAAS